MQLLGMSPDLGNQEVLIFLENGCKFFFQESRQTGITKSALSHANLKQGVYFPQITFVMSF